MRNTILAIEQVKNWFQNHPQVFIALSGGVDSCLVSFLARKYLGKENAISVISNSASLKQKDLVDAQIFAEKYDITLIEINANEINDPNYSSNPNNRCYYCKSNLYKSIRQLTTASYTNFEILNGNNFSDLGDYRPGLQAAYENKALSPLAECKIDKNTIREMSKYFELSIWNKPASPCLSSRFPYGEKITMDKLKQVEKAEDFLNTNGFNEVRVRYQQGNAKIEVPAYKIPLLKDNELLLKNKLKQYGFKNVSIDEEGFISGKLNRNININYL